MRRKALCSSVLFTVALAASCDSPLAPPTSLPDADDAALADSLRHSYEDIAALLALQEVLAEGGPATREVELPADLVRTLYNALVLVHNFDHPARDSVVEIYRIRPPTWPLYEVIVGIDTTREWTRAWRQGGALTGNRAVDDLVEAYELEIKRVGLFGDWVTIRAGRTLNTVALSARLEEIAGVRHAQPNGVVGDPPDIRVRDLETGWELTYRLGYGDCPAGCIQEHLWTFAVSTSGRVSFSGSAGDPAPPPRGAW